MAKFDVRSILREVEMMQTLSLDEEISRQDLEDGLRNRSITTDTVNYFSEDPQEGFVYRNNGDGSQDTIGRVLTQVFDEHVPEGHTVDEDYDDNGEDRVNEEEDQED